MVEPSIRDKVKLLKREERAELDEVRDKYRILIEEARKDCTHDYTEWYETLNHEHRYDVHYNNIWLRDCKLYGKPETRHGED